MCMLNCCLKLSFDFACEIPDLCSLFCRFLTQLEQAEEESDDEDEDGDD